MTTLDLTTHDNPNGRNAEWRSFTFPDGQPHISIRSPEHVTRIRTRITSSEELMLLLLARALVPSPSLYISYLLGGRMDRRMPMSPEGFEHPATLSVVAHLLNMFSWHSIALFDPHSEVSTALLSATPVLPVTLVKAAIQFSQPDVLIAPDLGASKRVEELGRLVHLPVVQAVKNRDPSTGQLSGFRLLDSGMVRDKKCLIVDDIIDGGGTFAGLALVLLEEEKAARVSLAVSHGIFSKGSNVAGVDHIYTTDSYQSFNASTLPEHVTVVPWG